MIFLALIVGIIAGLRAALALTAVAWAAARGGLNLEGSWLAFLGWRFTPWILSLLAIAELVTDQLPSTPSRKVPAQFGARLVSGGLSGAAIGYNLGSTVFGLMLGLVGAALGTYGGAAARSFLAGVFKSDRPAALIEDAVAIALSVFVYMTLIAGKL